jgi:hypothetical protein
MNGQFLLVIPIVIAVVIAIGLYCRACGPAYGSDLR